ncbi:MAG: hypothetical protein ACJ8M4_10835 [Chthoniobacterales bacterium]
MKAELPADVSFHPGPRLLVYRPRGILTEDGIQAVVDFLEKIEDRASKAFNRFTDLSKLDALDLEFKSVIRISLHRRLTYSQHAPVKSAFYVTSPAAARVVKVHALLTDHSPLHVKMFQELTAAAKWLDVSINMLQAEAAPTNGR